MSVDMGLAPVGPVIACGAPVSKLPTVHNHAHFHTALDVRTRTCTQTHTI